MSSNIRVPSNTHPLHRGGGILQADEDDIFYSAQNTPISRPHSFKNSIQQFAGSYSRASILYMADAISIKEEDPSSLLGDEEEQQHLYKNKSNDSDHQMMYKTFSQRTTDHVNYLSFEPLSRHTTVSSIISQQLLPQGTTNNKHESYPESTKSSFLQSAFNAVNVLVGVGILALPLSLRLAGWLYGSLIFLFCCLATNYTAKVIVKCLNTRSDHTGTYGDMGEIAFGARGRKLISIIFIVELITIGVAMIVLLGDGIQSLFPALDLVKTRMISLCILTPTVFLPIKKLAYTSLIGIIACFSLVVIVVYDGLSKYERPGSLFDPMETEVIPSDVSLLPLSFGLIMSGFAGHAVFPSIYRDMENPSDYNKMVNVTYQVTTVIYVFMAIIGYLMFGQESLQEITQNLALIEEYSQLLNRFAIWLLVLTPIAKYGLMLQPLNLSWELWFFGQDKVETWLKNHAFWGKGLLTVLGRSMITGILVYIALIFPGFDKVMSLLGALFSFSISIIFPVICHLYLFKGKLSIGETLVNWFILVTAILMAIAGTIWSIIPTDI